MKRKIVSLLLAVCMLALFAGNAYAQASGSLSSSVTDGAGLLQDAQIRQLEQMAQAVTDQYAVGVYIITLDDYREVDPAGVYEATYGIYHEYSLGEGAQRNGIVLLLSMAERDYALFRYGDQAVYAFSDFGLELLEEVFLDNFEHNDWNGGFEDYIRECDRYLEKAAAGKPVQKSPATLILIFCAIALAIAAAVCAGMVGQMKTVHKNAGAANYAGTLALTEQFDQFTRRTETRRKIQSNQNAQTHSGGRSGKF